MPTYLKESLEKRSYIDEVDGDLSALVRIPVVEKKPKQMIEWYARFCRDDRVRSSRGLVDGKLSHVSLDAAVNKGGPNLKDAPV